MCGVKTQIVTAIEIKKQTSADVRNFKPLLDTTVQNFDILEVSADKGYSSHDVLEQVDAIGATPYVMFTKSAKGLGGGIWETMYGIFMFQRKKFRDHYHQRSKIETAFSGIKRKVGNFVRSRKETAMKNEILCKFLCHNLVVLIHEMHELGIDPVFWDDGDGNQRPHLGYTATL